MKKFLLFGAALFAAVTINAETTAEFTSIASEADYVITNATKNESESTDKKFVYDIKGGDVLDCYMKSAPSVHFQITNGSDKAKAFVVNVGSGFEFGGKNGVMVFSNLEIGKAYSVEAAAKGETDGKLGVIDTDGKTFIGDPIVLPAKNKDAAGTGDYDEQGYVWKTFTFLATAAEMKLKETDGGIRVRVAVCGDASTALVNVEADAQKAVKFMRDGQLYIQRGNKVYNALGAVVEVAE
jgi:hypothetical protein